MTGQQDVDPDFDYVVVGAGTAGCVLANRLTRDGSRRVLLLEAGPEDRNIWLSIPAGVARVVNNPKVNWGYLSDPEPGLNHRRIIWPRGRVLGGSSSINGHVYMRGVPSDYDGWRDAGNVGWGWDDVLPYFKRSERHFGGESRLHGGDGEMAVSPLHHPHIASQAFVNAAKSLGVPGNDDFNGERQEGAGFLQFMIDHGRRASASAAFLRPARHRKNLDVRTGVKVRSVIVENGAAAGVEYRANGRTRIVRAQQTIVSSGAINSPQLLMLSGIGPGEILRRMGIDVAHDNPAVGQNLHDHVYAHYLAEVADRLSINRTISSNLRMAPHILHYALFRKGLLTSAAAQAGVFTRSHNALPSPDLQIQMRPFSMLSGGGMYVADREPAITASCTLLRPHSRGAVHLRSPDPDEPPEMYANYITDERDVPPMIAGLKLIRRIFSAQPLAAGVKREIMPGADARTDRQLVDYLRANAQSMYHPVGSCRMGTEGDAVVDPRLKVYGVDRLRVIDASIMPSIPSGNINAPTAMIAEKAADMIIEDERRG